MEHHWNERIVVRRDKPRVTGNRKRVGGRLAIKRSRVPIAAGRKNCKHCCLPVAQELLKMRAMQPHGIAWQNNGRNRPPGPMLASLCCK
jgi:hypothetical protein